MNDSPKQFAGVVIRNSRGEILLVQELKPACYGKYNLPGGHVEVGESPLSAVIREAQEETGLCIRPQWLLGAYQFHAGTQMVFLADNVDLPVVPGRGEVLAAAWHSIDEIAGIPDASILNPGKLRVILRDLNEGKQRRPAGED